MNLSSCLRKTICPPALKVALPNMLPLLADSVFLLGHAPIHVSLWMELQPFVLGLVVRIQEVCGLEWGKKITSLFSQTPILNYLSFQYGCRLQTTEISQTTVVPATLSPAPT